MIRLTPLTAEQEERDMLQREIDACQAELVRLIEKYEELHTKDALCAAKIKELRRDWPV